MEEQEQKAPKESESLTPLLPGLPDDLALRCIARLSNLACAAACATSRSWRAALTPSILNPVRKSLDIPSPQLLFLSLSTDSSCSSSTSKWFMVDLLHRQCLALSPPTFSFDSSLLTGRAVSTYGHFFLQLLGEVGGVPWINLLRFSRKPCSSSTSSSFMSKDGSSSSVLESDARADDSHVSTGPGQLKGQDYWVYDIAMVPNEDSSSTLLWCTWVGLGRNLYVAGGTVGNRATTMAMSFNGEQWKQLAPLNEPRFMAAGLVFKGKVWVLGGRRVTGAGMEMLKSSEVFIPEDGKWYLVPDMWPEHLQSMEEKVPCVVAVMGRIIGLKMGTNMIVVWDEEREGWDYLGLIGEKYVKKGFKGRILGVEDEKLWAITEEPVMVFELETSLEVALARAVPSEQLLSQTGENNIWSALNWRRIDDSELKLDGFQRVLECTLIEV